MKPRVDISQQLQRLSKGRTVVFSKDLADFLNVSFRCVLSWLYGDSKPTYSELKKVAQYFHVSVRVFLKNEAKVKLPWAQRVLVLKEGYLESSDIKSYIEFSSPYKLNNGIWVQR